MGEQDNGKTKFEKTVSAVETDNLKPLGQQEFFAS